MFKMKDHSDEIDWEKMIIMLYAYTLSLVDGKGWFRGASTKNYIGGKEIEDYVYEAITRYLENPNLYNPSKGTLIKFLKYYIIRALVNNDLVSSENRTSQDLAMFEIDEDDDKNYEERHCELIETFFDEEIDYSDIIKHINTLVANDEIAAKIFKGVTEENLKRREIIEIYKISSIDFDNGMRRLKTILKSVAKRFEIKKLK